MAEKLLAQTVGALPEDRLPNEPFKPRLETAMGSPNERPGKAHWSAVSAEL